MASDPFFEGFMKNSRSSTDSDSYPSVKSKDPFFNSFMKAAAKRRKEEQDAFERQQQLSSLTNTATTPQPQQQQHDNNPLKFLTDAIGNTGKFLFDAGKDVVDTAAGAYSGVEKVVKGQVKAGELGKNNEELAKLNKERGAFMSNLSQSDFDKPEVKKKLSEWETQANKLTGKANQITNSSEMKDSQAVDPTKTAFQAAETALNIGTLGVGKSLLKQGGKQVAKSVAEQGLKIGADTSAKAILKKVGIESAKDATIGAAYGVTQTGKNADKNTKPEDYALNALFGAGLGAAIPAVGAGLKAGVGKAKGAIQDAATKKAATKALIPADDLNAQLNQAIAEQSDKYGTSAFERTKNWVGDQVDPLRAFAKIDDKYAKANGIARKDLMADQSLEDLARRSAASEREAAGLFEKKLLAKAADGSTVESSAADLVKKYKGDSAAGQEFNNYTNAKFDLDYRERNGKPIQAGISDDQLKKFVSEYEAKNPDALKDIAVKKAVNDEAVDYMVRSKVISPEEAATIKNSSKFAVPLERVFPDDLARPEVTGKNIGSIAKQTVVQRLEGGSDIPLSNSFDTMLNRVYKSVSQGNRAKLAQALLARQEAGLIKGGKLAVVAGNKDARAAIRDNVALVNKGIRTLEKKVVVSNRQMRKIASELNSLQKEGLNTSLKEGGKTPLPDMAVGTLDKLSTTTGKTNTSRAFFKSLVEADSAHLVSIRNKIATREPKLAAKLDQVIDQKTRIDSLKVAKTNMKEVTADFMDDPTTGKQVISGVIDGQPYKMEVPPDLAKAVMGLDSQKLPSVLKALAIVKKPFEITWTGVLNPVFSGVSFAFYDTPMSIINSPQGFKTLAPKAVIESFKSLKSSSEFQKKLAAEGARPYGGSGASAFIKPSAKSIAAQRNILSKVAYTSTHPEVALSKLDMFGGKLANMTRTRVARAEYDAALKRGATEKQAMEQATLAYRTIMPDFDTMSNLTRQINAVVPFYAASVAGTRSLGKALKRDPAGTSAKALALGIAPITGVTAFSLMSPQGQEFYADMEKSGQKNTLDNNMVVVLPGAHKDPNTGEWTGVVKVPLAPEFRAMNQSVWRGVRSAMGKGDGPDASHIALSIFDTVTGGVRTSQNPLIDTVRILAGEDPSTGERIIKGNMADLPKNEQVYSTTSNAGKFIGDKLGTSGIQGDKILGQFGLAGQTARNGGKPATAVVDNVTNKFNGARGESAASSFYNSYSPVKAQRDKASRLVTELVKAGKVGEARRRAEEFNKSINGKFKDYGDQYLGKEGDNPDWHDMMAGLYIKTTEDSFKAREKQ